MKAVIKTDKKAFELDISGYPSRLGETLRASRVLSLFNGFVSFRLFDNKLNVLYIEFDDGIVIDFSTSYPEKAIISDCLGVIRSMEEDDKKSPIKIAD